MTSVSMLEQMPTSQSCCAILLNKAASLTDPLERFKLVMVTSVAFMYPSKIYEKPLNPVLGETYQAFGADGAKIYMEQTEHHPPISHMLIEGPNGNYKVTGWSTWAVSAGLNNATLKSDGHKKVIFADGQTIEYNNPGDYFYNIFMGTMGHQMTGRLDFKDVANNIYGQITFGCVKKKTQDYFKGEIYQNGKYAADIDGNYMGFMDIYGKRYFDVRELDRVWNPLSARGPSSLPSDSTKRMDSNKLA